MIVDIAVATIVTAGARYTGIVVDRVFHGYFRLCALGLAFALAGCGGGGAPISTPIPPVVPTPVPVPVPPPAPGPFDTAEYRRSNAAVAAGALPAYQAGASGRGVIAAVIDSGVNPDLAEFAGRISPLSRDLTGSRGLGDDDGHGTEVAGILLAARNNSSIHGIAPEAILLALRADRPGSCAETAGCGYPNAAIAAGVDAATSAGARVINISLGGGSGSTAVAAAAGRASAAGSIIVVSAGNDSATESDPLARALVAATPGRTIIVAGAIDEAGALADFSNRAGSLGNVYLTALGVRVRSFDQTGAGFLYSGTSESAPVIAGAVALLAQAFPNLSGAQIVDILLRTADDLGAAGTDAIFGRGALNIARAFQPVGNLSVAKIADPLAANNGTLGGAFGDAGQLGQALSHVIAHDSYDRPFDVNVAASLRREAPGRLANALLSGDIASAGQFIGNARISIAGRGFDRRGWRGDRLTGVDRRDQPQADFVAGAARLQLSRSQTAVLGYGQSVRALLQSATGGSDSKGGSESDSDSKGGSESDSERGGAPTPLVAGRATEPGLLASAGPGAALAQRLAGWTLGVGFGTLSLPWHGSGYGVPPRAMRAIARLERHVGALQVAAAGEFLIENGSILGSQFSSVFGVNGASTLSAVIEIGVPIGGWSLLADMRIGRTRPDLTGAGLWQGSAALASTAGSLTLWRDGILCNDDRFSLTIAQPLRASGGALLALGAAPTIASIAPTGREIAVEAGYARQLGRGAVSIGTFWRHQPGHIAESAADLGLAMRYRTAF